MLTRDQVKRKAEEALKAARRHLQRNEDLFLTSVASYPEETLSSGGRPLLEAAIGKSAVAESASHDYRQLINDLDVGAVYVPDIPRAKELLPGDSPILDKLLVKSKGNGPYQKPNSATLSECVTNRQLTRQISKAREVLLITLGQDSLSNIDAKLLTVTKLMEADEEAWPTCNSVALTVTLVHVIPDDYFAIFSPENRGNTVKCQPRRMKQDNAIPLPSKILISGHNWTLVIQFDIRVEDKSMVFLNCSFPINLIEWFKMLTVVSQHLTEPVVLRQWGIASGQRFQFQAVIETDCMAALTGLRIANITEL